jgi:4-hydroxyphenylpyruvate dioxygenase
MTEERPTKQARTLVGHANFVRHNPMSDRFNMIKFHHIEYWTSDAVNTGRRFTWGLGMHEVAASNLSTGNKHYSCSVIQSNDINFIFTAPYSNEGNQEGSSFPHPYYDQNQAHEFVRKHGMAVRAVGIKVDDASDAYHKSVENGAVGVCPPTQLVDATTGQTLTVSEIKSVDDVVLRFLSGDFDGPFLPNMTPSETPDINYGLRRVDHIVTNVPVLFDAVDYLIGSTGLHEFAEFTADDVGTVDSGLNSMVLANNSETILMPFNEPTHGTKRQSQIQTFLDHNNGAGVQHIALKTDDIFHTMRELRQRSLCGGFEFMPAPNQVYYDNVPNRIGADTLTADQFKELQTLGLLADRDDQGVLLQVFTKPLGDRPTIFIEIIQRIGCDKDEAGHVVEQAAGCGGFGKGNFSELFKSIEEFERQMEESAKRG